MDGCSPEGYVPRAFRTKLTAGSAHRSRAVTQSEGATMAIYDPSERLHGAAVFYMGRTLPEIQKSFRLQNFFTSNVESFVIARKDDMPSQPETEILREFDIGSRTIVVFKYR